MILARHEYGFKFLLFYTQAFYDFKGNKRQIVPGLKIKAGLIEICSMSPAPKCENELLLLFSLIPEPDDNQR